MFQDCYSITDPTERFPNIWLALAAFIRKERFQLPNLSKLDKTLHVFEEPPSHIISSSSLWSMAEELKNRYHLENSLFDFLDWDHIFYRSSSAWYHSGPLVYVGDKLQIRIHADLNANVTSWYVW